ncbi:putative mitochondrial TFIIF-stimulated CTD phosphatase [Leptomonas pyrrhocoris]|uniref:Mitochondrial import inner membrane translocase subunit TIM50 n=1 Tax=Leptomonas pyrrhocoris TaxID=157538 RepID=A0A0N0VE82_LEPPY|nr:putative mitochondrial TFIIF-stimulated CTD phosphatase [Leptomonas pyrrhocoris]XP_015655771.1 putative mitochondrial TFIIF-stimulated CTD phosphatase [Leptomonas pyrrhocoris]KPA77331.1 putative mitochondrial TFIIF-stimulated CTD phosphatase [Leptomonas pyrrhocoris]KPA77332.1 putative mitochondrial TFIIF-stimulated CTD phosphatase [Leptomonas pyrrhocoris]|eukprot:XP_015655770.1 putative mitochondrial TFIIF-stimulated CTD phosphatase [Leptomonas pyrrhocoris]
MPALKPLLVFGLRGTLMERIHVRNVPENMPAPDLTVGTSKVWLRPHMMEVLRALQPHCRLAIWSSTTARNSHPLVSAVFDSYLQSPAAAAASVTRSESSRGGGFAKTPVPPTAAPSATAAASASETSSGRGGRFDKKKKASPAEEAVTEEAAALAPIRFEFVWTREHTRADDFRRLNATVLDDNHATVKDLSQLFAQFPAIAQPENTVLIDDTPSKAKMHADNYLWLDTCQGLNVTETNGMRRLQEFVMQELVPARDVRDVLCRRIRND